MMGWLSVMVRTKYIYHFLTSSSRHAPRRSLPLLTTTQSQNPTFISPQSTYNLNIEQVNWSKSRCMSSKSSISQCYSKEKENRRSEER